MCCAWGGVTLLESSHVEYLGLAWLRYGTLRLGHDYLNPVAVRVDTLACGNDANALSMPITFVGGAVCGFWRAVVDAFLPSSPTLLHRTIDAAAAADAVAGCALRRTALRLTR